MNPTRIQYRPGNFTHKKAGSDHLPTKEEVAVHRMVHGVFSHPPKGGLNHKKAGSDLFSHTVAYILSSTLRRFMTLFGMGRDSATALKEPANFLHSKK